MNVVLLGGLAVLLAGYPNLLHSQTASATINGRISDPTGNSVPGVDVQAVNIDTNVEYSSRTNDDGIYVIPNIPPGRYRLLVRKEGFKEINKVNLELHVQDTVEQNFSLEVGSLSQSITVTGSVSPLNTETAKESSTISNTMVQYLPIVVGSALRSPLDLASLTPEGKNYNTSIANGAAQPGTNTSDSFSIGGGQPRAFGITLDGVTMMGGNSTPNSWLTYNTPPLDAITEFAVETNGYKAEFGHAQGGVMTFSSKSGTNALHGSAFEFLRNTDLDANYFFSNKLHIPRSIYKQNDFGVNAGGPIVIPHLIDGRNKAFFYADYEGFRNRVGANATSFTVPTAKMLNGDFSDWVNSSGQMIPIYDPTTTTLTGGGTYTRTAFPNNYISPTVWDPLAKQLVGVFAGGPGGQVLPNTTAPDGTVGAVQSNYFVTKGTVVTPWNKLSLKGDYIINNNNRISGYYGRTRETNTGGPDGAPVLPGDYSSYQPQSNKSDVFRAGWTRTMTPNILNYFFAGVNDWKQYAQPYQEIQGNWKSKFCYPNVPNCDLNLPNLTFGSDGYTQWGSSSDSGSNQPVFSFNDNLTWSRGRHTFKFGGTYQRNYYDGLGDAGAAGIIGFATGETAVPGNTNYKTGGGNSFASFLLGQADSGRIDTHRLIAQEYRYIAGFVQDDFRASRRLTLNLGLRWETTLPDVNPDNKLTDFDPTKPNPAANNIPGALVFAGFGPGRIGRTDFGGYHFRGFGPRIGAAYSLTSKTVIRAAYSRSFGFDVTAQGSAHYAGFFQIYTPANTTSGVEPTWTFQNGFPAYPLPPILDPSFANGNSMQWFQGGDATLLPTIDSWTLSIQRQLSPSMMLEVAYSADKGTHLLSGLDNYNQVPFSDFEKYGGTVLNSGITSPAAVMAGIPLPYPTFTGSVAQALRPFPQYLTIDTAGGGGDHSSNSEYEALIVQLQKRMSSGLTIQTSYVYSKLMDDSEGAAQQNNAMDQARHFLDKSISGDDLTHNFKLAWVYELPLGKGKRFVNTGVASALLGDWRVSAIQSYSSGFPVALATTISLPIFAGPNRPTVPSNYGWGCSARSNFDPSVDTFFQPASWFGTQPTTTFGNATRYNGACRQFPNYNENLSVNRKIRITERLNLDLRMEGFNIFNRVRFGTGSTTLQSATFGKLTSNNDIFNTPRQLQAAVRLNW
jgi:hypothetical protein